MTVVGWSHRSLMLGGGGSHHCHHHLTMVVVTLVVDTGGGGRGRVGCGSWARVGVVAIG